MKFLAFLSVVALTSQVALAVPVPDSKDLEIDALHKGIAALSNAMIEANAAKEKREVDDALTELAERQLVYQNAYGCKRWVDGVEKRVPCLPEDTAAEKAKRQLVYQNAYGCKRWVDGIEKRVPCLPEDTAAE